MRDCVFSSSVNRVLSDIFLSNPNPGVIWLASRNPHGDWHSYTHLSSRRQFSESMKPRSLEMENLLRGRADPWCRVCGNYQRFSEHIPGPAHWKNLTERYIKDGVRVADVREGLWNIYELNGEVYRFNELDGSIERMKSQHYPPQVHAQPTPGGTSFPKKLLLMGSNRIFPIINLIILPLPKEHPPSHPISLQVIFMATIDKYG